MKVKITEVQGLSHTLTQTDGATFRLFAKESKVIDEKLVSKDFYAELNRGNMIITPVEAEREEIKNKDTKGGRK